VLRNEGLQTFVHAYNVIVDTNIVGIFSIIVDSFVIVNDNTDDRPAQSQLTKGRPDQLQLTKGDQTSPNWPRGGWQIPSRDLPICGIYWNFY